MRATRASSASTICRSLPSTTRRYWHTPSIGFVTGSAELYIEQYGLTATQFGFAFLTIAAGRA